MSDIPEAVRERIKKLVDEASINIIMDERVKHMMTQICYEMYKAGYKDSFRMMEASIKIQKDLFLGKDIVTNSSTKGE